MPNTSTRPDLRLVSAESEVYDLMRAPVTTSERVRRLRLEARALAVEQVEVLEKVVHQAAQMAREIASRLATDLPIKARTISTIVARSVRSISTGR